MVAFPVAYTSYNELKGNSSAVFGNVVEFQAPQMCPQLPGTAELLSSAVCLSLWEPWGCLLPARAQWDWKCSVGIKQTKEKKNKQKKNQTNKKPPSLFAPKLFFHAEHSFADLQFWSFLTTILMGLAVPLLPAVLCYTDYALLVTNKGSEW